MSWNISLLGLAVIVVDDHADSRELAAEILTSAGAKVVTASSGREAAALLAKVWSAIVTDINMPDGNGYDLIRQARQNGGDVPIIAITALDTPEYRSRIVASGFACHLVKPVLPERLIEAVWRVSRDAEVPITRRRAANGSTGLGAITPALNAITSAPDAIAQLNAITVRSSTFPDDSTS